MLPDRWGPAAGTDGSPCPAWALVEWEAVAPGAVAWEATAWWDAAIPASAACAFAGVAELPAGESARALVVTGGRGLPEKDGIATAKATTSATAPLAAIAGSGLVRERSPVLLAGPPALRRRRLVPIMSPSGPVGEIDSLVHLGTVVTSKSPDKGRSGVVSEPVTAGTGRLTREESRARTRSLLIDAAAKLFAERGFAAASVEEIAGGAGFSRGAFYSNFESKDDLFLAVLDAHIEREVSSIAHEFETSASPEAFFEFLRARAVRRAREGREWSLLWAEFWLHVVRNPELAPKLAARQRAARTAIAAIIEAQFAQLGIELSLPAEHLASLMLAVDDGLVLQEHLDPSAVPDDLRARATVLLVQGAAVGLPQGEGGSGT